MTPIEAYHITQAYNPVTRILLPPIEALLTLN